MKNNFTPSLGSIFLKPAGANPLAFYCRYGLNLICVLIFGGAFQSALHAQTPPDLAWEVNYGSNSNDEARNIIQTSDGGYLVVGEVNGGTGDVAGSGYLGNSDGWVVKLNPSGTILWKKAYGTSSYDLGIFQAIEVSDGYVLVGSTYFSGGFSTDKLWYAKVAKSTGVPLANWTFQYNSTGQSVGHTIVTTPDGGFLIGGTLYDNGSKALLLKTNSAGVVTSTYTSNPSGGLWGKVITQIEKTPDSGYALLGAYHDINEPGCNPNAEVSDRYDVWVCKFSSTFSDPGAKFTAAPRPTTPAISSWCPMATSSCWAIPAAPAPLPARTTWASAIG